MSEELQAVKILLPAEENVASEDVNKKCMVSYRTKSPHNCLTAKESLNNAFSDSQSNLCNGAATTTSATTLHNVSSGLKKVLNGSPNNYKKPTISLTHLPKRPLVDIEFINMSYSVSEGRQRGYKTILKCINGKFLSGELTVIMGPSGAGKSTLMNILAGYKTSNLDGSVLINGKERSLRRFRKMSCYIMQDDCLSPNLTVTEAMMVSANLKLGKDLNKSEKKIVIEEVMEVLGLTECRNTITLSLSGGQKKRLSIALELVNNPPVMFFDEPTSGLDSSSCFQCISLLKSLARGGRTVICTIHQPSARLFEMFDHLYILSEGQCIYKGKSTELVPFLSSEGFNCPSYHNPADYVIEVACGDHGDYLEKLVVAVNSGKCKSLNTLTYNALPNATNVSLKNTSTPCDPKAALAKENVLAGTTTTTTCTTALLDSTENLNHSDKAATFPISSWQQFWILLKRTFRATLRDTQLTRMRLLAHFIIGILIGLIYYDIGNDAGKVMSNAGCMFFTVMFTMFTAMMPTILTFPLEMSVFVREHLNYWYSIKAYYFAKTVADIPFQIVLTICYVMGVYYITSQPMEPLRFGMFILVSVLTALVAQSLGLLVGAAFDIESGVFLGPISTIPMVLLSGFFVNLNDIPFYLKWLPYTSYVRYSFEAILISIYGLNRAKLQCNDLYCHFKYPTKFLSQMSMNDDLDTYLIDVAILGGLFVLLRVCAYFVLRIKVFSNR